MRRRIAEIAARHKGLLEAAVLPAVVVLIGLSAFGLGRLSATDGAGSRLIIRMPDGTTESASVYASQNASAPIPAKAGTQAWQYIASKTGTKYYLPNCSGVSRIKEENRVYFETVEEAQAAGYTAAANCPGL